MKKFCIILLVLSIITLTSVACAIPSQTIHEQYLRIHIRANSNTEQEQAVKYLVSGKVVEFLTPIVAECNTKGQAESAILDNLYNIECVCNQVLTTQGYSYKASARLASECFPTRVYNGFTLESGFYDALIIELGSGKGENWWCVVYPPLCFKESAGYIYKSKILCIINDFFNKGEKKNEKTT